MMERNGRKLFPSVTRLSTKLLENIDLYKKNVQKTQNNPQIGNAMGKNLIDVFLSRKNINNIVVREPWDFVTF